ncbi:hypothetical protein HW090_11020 [Pseudomonas sp. ABC1]|uniref:hypothetical protein n=1 Tax=Pseudomonas sp. ABC1 TaxID=2748080 RepID=UPI0015C3EAA3|nr:hypothetical protein [Pseudomonas sp. ABC1]QLF93697.1 hypothetical protein HW090_11020 [Pseudomonas sp. ABC1]
MRLWNRLYLVVLLALLSAFGIVMMLVVDGAWDKALLLLATLPLLLGGYRGFRFNRKR